MLGANENKLNEEQIRKALSTVMDPDLNIDVVTLGMISDIKITGSKVFFQTNTDNTGLPS